MYGRLQNRKLSFAVNSECANSGRPIKFELDSDLNVASIDDGSEPMFCVALIDIAKIREPSILDIF